METLDIVVGPIILMLVYSIAYWIRPWVTTIDNRKFFIPALSIKILSAVALGLLYQFYYGGGDTFTYFTHGAKNIYEAFYDSPAKGLTLIFGPNNYQGEVFQYASKIWMYRDVQSFAIVRIAGFVSLFTAGTYTGTAIIFATFSFSGLWAMFFAFNKLFVKKGALMALAILFIPSAVFWGSGILKDTVTFGMLGWSTAALIHLLYRGKNKLNWLVILLLSLSVIYWIKTYIVMSFLPAAIVWAYLVNMYRIRSKMLRILMLPFISVLAIALASLAVYEVSKSDSKYAIDRIAETVKVTAYDVGRWTGRNAGSRYDLGDLDGTFSGMVKLAPAAINVALFRPYFWEVGNPLMLMAAIEGFIILVLTVIVFLMRGLSFLRGLAQSPALVFCLIFSLTFAFAVGISTYNFGTLFRYKVPLMPYFALLLVLTWSLKSNRSRGIRFKKPH